MKVLTVLVLLLIIMPAVELFILFKVYSHLGLMSTILLVFLTGALGATLAKWQGLSTWRRIQSDLQMGIVPSGRLIDSVLILIAGILLITPGLLTDAVGFILLIPATRDRIKRRLRDWFESKVKTGQVRFYFGP